MQNAGNLKSLERLEVIRKLNGASREWVNDDLYRLMLRKDMYVLAYERLKSIPGNMTPGTDDETLDGFLEEEIGKIIAQMKDESYQCRPEMFLLPPFALCAAFRHSLGGRDSSDYYGGSVTMPLSRCR